MSDLIEQLIPAPSDLRAVFYDEDPEAKAEDGERVLALALVKIGGRRGVVPVVIDPDGEIQLATEDSTFLGTAWGSEPGVRIAMLKAEMLRRHPEMKKAKK